MRITQRFVSYQEKRLYNSYGNVSLEVSLGRMEIYSFYQNFRKENIYHLKKIKTVAFYLDTIRLIAK